LSGTLTVAAVSGVATFSTISIDKVGTGYTLDATASGLTTATSNSFDITLGSATQLAFSVEPSNTVATASISPAIEVQVHDAGGNLISAATDSITLAIGTNPSSGTLSGTLVVAAVSGEATFSDISIDNTGTGYTLTANAGGLTGATSASFNITGPPDLNQVHYRWRNDDGGEVGGGSVQIAFGTDRDGNSEVYIMDTDGTNQTNLSNNPASDANPAVSPDGTKILFISGRDLNNEVYVMDADGTNQTNLSNNAAKEDKPAWSNDGTKIVFRTDRDVDFEIYTMDADGTNQTNISNNAAKDEDPAWSPDGTKIAFRTDRDVDTEIYVMDADGTNPVNLTNSSLSGEFSPAWSPDGTKIAFVSDRDGNNEIYVMNSDGTGQTRLTNNAAKEETPEWSSDGTKIVFVTDRDVDKEIYVMDTDGTNQTNLSNNAAVEKNPYYSSSGSGATWAAAEDTAITGLDKNTLRRLRFEISNGGGTSGAITYQLEYATSTSGPWTTVPDTATTEHWETAASANITDGEATQDIASGLTNANTTFVAGELRDTASITSGITLTSTEFTEIEYSIKAHATNATDSQTYYFRLPPARYRQAGSLSLP